ncbi:MAG: PLDc N-terminal domain-containing protein [Defluviitaleaceae bacterium]|nr:PLDc N-terminal domain-containing protein [Defluviitaleaceae bacterium]
MTTFMTISSIVAFVVCILAMVFFLCAWTYHDAKVKSTQSPWLWVLVVLLVPNFLGFVVYLLVGRTKKDVPAPGKFKWMCIIMAVLTVISFVVFITGIVRIAFFEGSGAGFSGTTFMSSDISTSSRWTFTARSANAERSRTRNLQGADFENFHVDAAIESGSIYLRLEQGSIIQRVDIGNLFGYIDLQEMGFQPGRLRMTLEMRDARGVRSVISWR